MIEKQIEKYLGEKVKNYHIEKYAKEQTNMNVCFVLYKNSWMIKRIIQGAEIPLKKTGSIKKTGDLRRNEKLFRRA